MMSRESSVRPRDSSISSLVACLGLCRSPALGVISFLLVPVPEGGGTSGTVEVVRGLSLGAEVLTGVEEWNPVAPSVSRAGTDEAGLEWNVRDGIIV